MYYTAHAPTGILISQQTENLWLIFLLAIIFHFILDIIPHGDFKVEKWVNKKNPKSRFLKILITDGFISLSLITIIYLKLRPQNPWPFLVAIFGSALPDLLWLPLKFIKTKPRVQNNIWIKIIKKYRSFHSKLHNFIEPKMPVWLGLTFQALVVVILVYFILKG